MHLISLFSFEIKFTYFKSVRKKSNIENRWTNFVVKYLKTCRIKEQVDLKQIETVIYNCTAQNSVLEWDTTLAAEYNSTSNHITFTLIPHPVSASNIFVYSRGNDLVEFINSGCLGDTKNFVNWICYNPMLLSRTFSTTITCSINTSLGNVMLLVQFLF